jgi:hypothetical protein
MTRIHIALLLAAIASVSLAPAAHADDKPGANSNPLDRALDDTTDNSKPAPAKPADNKATAPVDILDPDAVNALDTDDLVKKLTGGTPKAEGPEAMMKEILSRMDDSAKRLHDRDPGSLTQETQKRITMNLDQLIELVRQQQQQQSSSQSQSKSDSEAQKRQRMQGNQEGPHNQGGNNAAKQSTLPNGASATPESNGTDIHQRSREWGNLPERERDLIVHGSKEELLPSYKDLIQRYYQSLAEINKTTRDR